MVGGFGSFGICCLGCLRGSVLVLGIRIFVLCGCLVGWCRVGCSWGVLFGFLVGVLWVGWFWGCFFVLGFLVVRV